MLNQVHKILIVIFLLYISIFIVDGKRSNGTRTLIAESINNSYNDQINRFTTESWNSDYFNFNGIITRKDFSVYDTTKTMFYVCDSLVRIDEYNNKNELKNTFIFNINNNEYYIINDKLKKYKYEKLTNKNYKSNNIIKTRSMKIINGKKCFLWKIKTNNKIYSYWVTGQNFNFFVKISRLYYNRDKLVSLFASSDLNGIMPMEAEERDNVRRLIRKMEITNIETATIDKSVFTIPENYKLIN